MLSFRNTEHAHPWIHCFQNKYFLLTSWPAKAIRDSLTTHADVETKKSGLIMQVSNLSEMRKQLAEWGQSRAAPKLFIHLKSNFVFQAGVPRHVLQGCQNVFRPHYPTTISLRYVYLTRNPKFSTPYNLQMQLCQHSAPCILCWGDRHRSPHDKGTKLPLAWARLHCPNWSLWIWTYYFSSIREKEKGERDWG